jgi:hypothetical protein
MVALGVRLVCFCTVRNSGVQIGRMRRIFPWKKQVGQV